MSPDPFTIKKLIDLDEFKLITENINPISQKYDINYLYKKHNKKHTTDAKDKSIQLTFKHIQEGLNLKHANPNPHFIFMFPIIKDIHNKNDETLLIGGSAIRSYFDTYTDYKYDVVEIHNKHQLDTYKNLRTNYGNISQDITEQFDNLIDNINNKYDITIYTQPSLYVNADVSHILTSIMFQYNFYNIILSLASLKNKGTFGFLFRTGIIPPSNKKLLGLIYNLFKTVTPIHTSTSVVFLHCTSFDREKYLTIKDSIIALIKSLPQTTYQQLKEDVNMFINETSKSKSKSKSKSLGGTKRKSKSINKSSNKTKENVTIVYDIDIDIDLNLGKLDIMEVEHNYINAINKMNKMIKIHDEKELTEIIMFEYIKKFLEICAKYKFPYNKYFVSLLDNYKENIYTNMLSLTQPINLNIIKYNNSMEQLNKIKYTDTTYKYEVFDNIYSQFMRMKKVNIDLVSKYGESKLKTVSRVADDFTRGISRYLYSKYKLDIVPSNAFTKLWEIYMIFNLIPRKGNVKMFHMAEAPGQFIKSTEYYIKKNIKDTKYTWKANSLNPNNKEVTDKYGKALFRDDYQLIKENKKNWIWGVDDTGDITKSENIRWYRKTLQEWSKESPIDVVTGDGGLELERQTVELQKLDYGQFLLTVATCSLGKHCIIKTFTPFFSTHNDTENASGFYTGLTYLYTLFFKEVYLFKPHTSRPLSGEYYVIGKYFMGITEPVLEKLLDIMDKFKLNQCFFDKNSIPKTFVSQLYKFVEMITTHNQNAMDKLDFFFTCLMDKSEIKKELKCEDFIQPENLEKIYKSRYEKWISLYHFK